MLKLSGRKIHDAGLPPGTLVRPESAASAPIKITLIDYDKQQYAEKEISKIEDCFQYKDSRTVSWINIDGLNDIGMIEKLGAHFGIHPLMLEDVLNTAQRPKIDEYEDYLFIVLKMLKYDEENASVDSEQVSLITGKNIVISFQERSGDVFNPIRDRIRKGKGRIREGGADYLAYALIDAIVDNYFIIPEKYGEIIENMEDNLIREPTPEIFQSLHNLKREMIFLRKAVWPLREVISTMIRGESKLIHKTTVLYLRDVYDHTIQVMDSVESSRDLLSGMVDMYMSSMSNKMNEVMKVLTVIATIFIPLTFIVGIYGMNFNYMPELGWKWAYFAVWGVMIFLAGSMVIYFKKRKWL
ncbi:MAG: magnesium/cobalt transporter CorA [bacterium]